ncbi:hypothetical protein DFA_06665 [Cavenderia fasciculata]|uniref:Carbohydrate kinase PfkB domain-containing protein n=1 Tax=Cavenderia fasciculata TaxID=261658 RepID=F4Q1X9_CACFS|nr:uncharacterized protein DFA_06665 [Cavenderia fasciculata]EGG17999.1 hypothetical protein DFA_06665 [Cavenderia fasciculata]|eukprot:XP_004356892.1 hypothetical protein DFA_06665 [Cavenderia fasciculata]
MVGQSKLLFVGNFVNDVIINHRGLTIKRDRSFHDLDVSKIIKDYQQQQQQQQQQTSSTSLASSASLTETETTDLTQSVGISDRYEQSVNIVLGGSVTYGSLAASSFGGATSYVVSEVGSDINQQFTTLIDNNPHINIDHVARSTETKTSSYQLDYYNNHKSRSLSLKSKGSPIDPVACLQSINDIKPDAIFFVPVCAELDCAFVSNIVESIVNQPNQPQSQLYRPTVVACDVQGFLRTFIGERVSTRPALEMDRILQVVGRSFSRLGDKTISIIKAEHGEAVAILGDHDPGTCAKLLCDKYGFTVACVTMGGNGGFVSSSQTGQLYVPTFKPTQVADETGCGDTFLTCLVLELLSVVSQRNKQLAVSTDPYDKLCNLYLTGEDILHCVQVGSAGASFLVEQIGPNGFGDRTKIIDRVTKGEKQPKVQYLQWNKPKSMVLLSPGTYSQQQQLQPKQQPIKSITNYFV